VTDNGHDKGRDSLRRYPVVIGGDELLLTAAEEVELAKRIERGDQSAKEELVDANVHLVGLIVKRYRNQGVPFPDLVNAGMSGLDRAAEKFDYRKDGYFKIYATGCIRQEVARAFTDKGLTIQDD
jgi:RNA polymerase primary sigma factor